MAAVRPVLTVYKLDGSAPEQVKTPAVFTAPIRNDLVHTVHTHMSKNRRQPYAVNRMAGMQHSAESWGTGRAVARIPRVSGGGTARAGQGAFGNMCRKGRMFAPTKIWRRWHRRTSVNQKRYAVVSALAASAVPALVMARGHSIGRINECPLVVDDSLQSITKTKAALRALKRVGAYTDVARTAASRKVRTGVSRYRNRLHSVRRGPLIVFSEDNGVSRAFRNLPGVEVANVNSLNLLQLAPGGTIGRFIVWTKSAVAALHDIYGSVTRPSTAKKGYTLPRHIMTNPDLDRLINSNEIQSKLRLPKKAATKRRTKLNPLTNFAERVRLNPYAKHLRLAELARQARAKREREARLASIREGKPVERSAKAAKRRAVRKALAKQSAATFARITSGRNVENPGFDKEVYRKALQQRVSQPAPKAPMPEPGSLNEHEKKRAHGAQALREKTAKHRAAVSAYVKKKVGAK